MNLEDFIADVNRAPTRAASFAHKESVKRTPVFRDARAPKVDVVTESFKATATIERKIVELVCSQASSLGPSLTKSSAAVNDLLGGKPFCP
jgi:hypothetical protein